MNLHKLYYKDYYNGIEFELDNEGKVKATGSLGDIVGKSKVADSSHLHTPDFTSDEYYKEDGLYKPTFEVLYPGLVTGVGIRHRTKAKGEFKLGMHFDYTYGLPVIYGSSVKGVLRSYFKEVYKGEDADALIADIFDGKDYNDKNTPFEKRRSKPTYERDVFFDAIIAAPNKGGYILESDAITPHGGDKHDNPFAEPNPVPFVKIASGVKLKFRFKLVDTLDDNGEIVCSVEDKKDLFMEILTTFGIGAKTNVGYGQLEIEASEHVRKGKRLLSQAKSLFENKDYHSAKSIFEQARDLLEANSKELRDCLDGIEKLKSIEFDQHIDAGISLMQNKDYNAAEQEFEAARNYAEKEGIFTDTRKSIVR